MRVLNWQRLSTNSLEDECILVYQVAELIQFQIERKSFAGKSISMYIHIQHPPVANGAAWLHNVIQP